MTGATPDSKGVSRRTSAQGGADLKVDTPVQFVKGIGPERAKALGSEGIATVRDLLLILPRRYEDRSSLAPIKSLKAGVRTTVSGRIVAVSLKRARRMPIFEAMVEDFSGRIKCVFFGQAYLKESFKVGRRVIVHGAAEWDRYGGGLAFHSPDAEILDEADGGGGSAAEDGGLDEAIHMGRVVPVYEKRGMLLPKVWRRILTHLVRSLPQSFGSPDHLTPELRADLGVVGWREAIIAVHDPSPGDDLDALNRARSRGHLRLILEEFFLFALGLAAKRLDRRPGVVVRANEATRQTAKRVLPFPLTSAQKRVLKEIAADLESGREMNRLLQGDVGSGKTIVATLAMLLPVSSGKQAVLVAPTEVLADQHFITLSRVLAPVDLRVTRLSGRLRSKERKQALEAISSGEGQVIVGTHALFEPDVIFKSLALAIVDEQHRFGVIQRDELRRKGEGVHALVMTATPIPRTLALSFHGDLDTSVLDEKPPGRMPIRTSQRFEGQRGRIVDTARQHLDLGRQVYVVCPLIEESEKLADVRAVTRLSQEWAAWLPGARVGALHGRLPRDEKGAAMDAFVRGETQVLVSTTVIEVGVDVPNATLMVIEQAERFGVAQLHQLRGRVGRGRHPSECLLVTRGYLSDQAKQRIEAIVASEDGFFLAEKDLEIRGPGEFFGTRQSGRGLFQAGDPVRDRDLLIRARDIADGWWKTAAPDHPLRVYARGDEWTGRFGLSRVG
ncbi:MAG: ATP-dependent DNA helicase RecG [Vicinamibacteria bacterium]|nr:ATP-dependent DNA helicase RecG [Vicinamibacteria bacterium]